MTYAKTYATHKQVYKWPVNILHIAQSGAARSALLTKCYSGDRVKNNEADGHVESTRETSDRYRIRWGNLRREANWKT